MCDAFLVLAQADGGLSCFLLPRVLPDGDAQPLPPPAPEGQARQPLERVQRGRVRRRLGPDGRRGGPRRADDHRDGQPHAARLRARLDGRDAARRRAGDPPRRAPLRLRQAPDRPAADAERARRPVHRVGGRDGHGDAAGARLRPGRATTSARRSSSASPRRSPSTGSASAGRCTRSRRSSASAATATSRSRACRGSTARRR